MAERADGAVRDATNSRPALKTSSLYEVDAAGRKLHPDNGYGGAVDPFDFSLKKDTLMNQTKVVLSKDGHTVYRCVPVATSWEDFKKQCSVEGIDVPEQIPPAASL